MCGKKIRLVDTQDVFNVLSDYYHHSTHVQHLALQEALNKVPTVDAEPVRHGKWIYGNEFHWYTASCNRCGYKRTTDIKAANWNAWKYCPNCGARMDKE